MTVIIPPGSFIMSIVHTAVTDSGSKPTWTVGITGPPDLDHLGPILAWLEGDYADALSEAYRVEKLMVTTADGSATIPTNIDGNVPGDVPPSSVSLLIQKTTGAFGRTSRGRMYWPGFVYNEDLVPGGLLTEAVVTSYQAVVDGFYNTIIDAELLPVLLHSASSDPTPIDFFTVEAKVATQRRRLRG